MQGQFNYEQFRLQASQKLKKGHSQEIWEELLAPVVIDLLKTALQADVESKPKESTLGPSIVENTDVSISDAAAKIGSEEGKDVGRMKPSTFAHYQKAQANVVKSSDSQLSTKSKIQYRSLFIEKIEQRVLDLFKGGKTYPQIQSVIELVYNQRVTVNELIDITTKYTEAALDWNKRPLKSIYAFLWVTAVPFQSLVDGKISDSMIYSLIAVDLNGNRDIIGQYVYQAEATARWPYLLNDIRDRGVNDILIACVDDPIGLNKVIKDFFPQTHVHGYIMHQLRTSFHYLTGPHRNRLSKALKKVYTMWSEQEAMLKWQEFKKDFGDQYPLIVESWEQNWKGLMGTYQYPTLVRELAQGTKLDEQLYQNLQKLSKRNEPFHDQRELVKSVYIVSEPLVVNYKFAVNKWGYIIQHMAKLFGERVRKHLNA